MATAYSNGNHVNKSVLSSAVLDSTQYTNNGILRYEFVFGRGYVSSGGAETTHEALKSITIEKGGKAIDIGCGIGGAAHDLAEARSISVVGLDLSENMVAIANQRYSGDTRLSFRVVNCAEQQAVQQVGGEGEYGLVFSRDTLLHLNDDQKRICFANAHKWLKNGGQVVITDYICGPHSCWDAEFESYVNSRGYHLLELETYKQMIEAAGFDVVAEDRTKQWIVLLEKELKKLDGSEKFLESFSEKDLEELRDGWQRKMKRAKVGMHKWGYFVAVKKQEISDSSPV
eukprot:GHVS01009164.1.p1 GENE.GHVS01009164.1~~GHVS01009164.1.p1  ORF type:complete len:286 (+),score=47.92 GHVS01009164.1:260-1117(+)